MNFLHSEKVGMLKHCTRTLCTLLLLMPTNHLVKLSLTSIFNVAKQWRFWLLDRIQNGQKKLTWCFDLLLIATALKVSFVDTYKNNSPCFNLYFGQFFYFCNEEYWVQFTIQHVNYFQRIEKTCTSLVNAALNLWIICR